MTMTLTLIMSRTVIVMQFTCFIVKSFVLEEGRLERNGGRLSAHDPSHLVKMFMIFYFFLVVNI
jgi:hypothetical protein